MLRSVLLFSLHQFTDDDDDDDDEETKATVVMFTGRLFARCVCKVCDVMLLMLFTKGLYMFVCITKTKKAESEALYLKLFFFQR